MRFASTCSPLFARLVVGVLAMASSLPLSAQPVGRSALAAKLDSVLSARIATGAPGCVVGAERAGERVLFARGLADLETGRALDTLSVLEAGSVSKQFTAGVVLRLAQRGALSLDQPARSWITELSPSLPAFTIRQLLTHEAGLREWADLVAVQGWPRGTADHRQTTIVSLIAHQRSTNFTPGAEYLYSNSNFVLAAELAARAGGASFDTVSRRELFAPLGLTHTSWRSDFRTPVANRARAFTTNDAGSWLLDMANEGVVGHGGLLTSVPDLLRWLRALDAPSLLGASFVPDMERAGVLSTGRVTAYALGLELDSIGGARVISHAGATAGYRAYAGRVPSRDTRLALLCNNGDLNTEELGPLLLAMAAGLPLPVYYPSSPPALGDSLINGPRGRMAGRFRNERTRAVVTVRAFEQGLTLNTWVAYRNGKDANAFHADDQQRTLRMSADAQSFYIAWAGDTVRYTRVAPWNPSASELDQLVGTYHDQSTNTTWHVTRDTTGLRASPRLGATLTLSPLYPDAFRNSEEGFTITVERSAAGRIVGLMVWSGRSRALAIRRLGDRRE